MNQRLFVACIEVTYFSCLCSQLIKKLSLYLDAEKNDFIHYDDKAIDALLDRSKEGVEAKEGENAKINEYLSSFKVATYKYSEKHVEVRSHDRHVT